MGLEDSHAARRHAGCHDVFLSEPAVLDMPARAAANAAARVFLWFVPRPPGKWERETPQRSEHSECARPRAQQGGVQGDAGRFPTARAWGRRCGRGRPHSGTAARRPDLPIAPARLHPRPVSSRLRSFTYYQSLREFVPSAPWSPAPSPPFGTEERAGERRRFAMVTRFAWAGHPSPRPSPRSCLTGRGRRPRASLRRLRHELSQRLIHREAPVRGGSAQ